MDADRVVIDPAIRHGKPVIRGTRVPVDILLGSLAAGMTIPELVREYGVTAEDVKAAIAYAARLVAGEEIRPFHAEA